MDKDRKPANRTAKQAKPGERSRGPYGKPANRPAGRPQSGKPFPKSFDRKPKPASDPNAPSSLSRKVALEIFQDVVRKDAFASLSGINRKNKFLVLPRLEMNTLAKFSEDIFCKFFLLILIDHNFFSPFLFKFSMVSALIWICRPDFGA